MEIAVHETIADLQRAAADLVAAHLESGGTDVALAGGNTPKPVHRHLAAARLDWSNVTLWLGDERWVPADHEDSNTRMVRETLADAVGARLVAPDTGGNDPETAAAGYETALRTVLQVDESGRLRPGLVMLGMGDDGHTASLFPGSSALEATDRDYVATWVETKQTWRLTATLPALWAAHKVVFMVTGSNKADVVREILHEAAPYPAQRVAAGAPDVTWLLDAAAASALPS